MPIVQTSERHNASSRVRDKRESCSVSSPSESFTSREGELAPTEDSVEAFTLVLRIGAGSKVCGKGSRLLGCPGRTPDSTGRRD